MDLVITVPFLDLRSVNARYADELKAAAARVLELHPTFRYGRQFAGVNCAPALAATLGDALRIAGLPE